MTPGTTEADTRSRSWAGPFLPLMIATGFALGMTAPLEVLYAKRFGAGNLAVAVFLMSSAFSVLLVDVFGTRFVPRLEARGALAVGLLVFGASSVVTGVSPTFAPLVAARMAQGFGAAVLNGAALQAAVRVYDSREHALGSVQGSLMLGSAVGAPCGGLVAMLLPGTGGYRLAFHVCAVVCVAIVAALRLLLPPLPSDRPAEIGLPHLTGHAMVRQALVLGVLGNYLRSGVENTALPLVGDARGYSTGMIGAAIGLLSAVEIATLQSAGRLPAWRDPGRCLMAASAAGIVAAVVLALVTLPVAYFAAALVFGLVIAVAMVAPALIIMSLSSDTSTGLASYRIACGVGSLMGATSVNAALAAVGTAGALSAVGGVLLGGMALVGSIARRVARGG